jgi:NCS2 family nucleobase:cation symporter-2
VQPDWFSYFFTYEGDNKGLAGLTEAVVLVVEEPYLIAGLIAVTLNAALPMEKDDVAGPTSEEGRRAWNQHYEGEGTGESKSSA